MSHQLSSRCSQAFIEDDEYQWSLPELAEFKYFLEPTVCFSWHDVQDPRFWAMSSSFSSVSSPASAVQPRTASLVWPPHHAISPHFIRAVVGHLSPQHAFLRSPVCQPLWRTLVCPDLESRQQFPIILICRNPLESWFHHSLCQCSLFIHRSSSTHQTPCVLGNPPRAL